MVMKWTPLAESASSRHSRYASSTVNQEVSDMNVTLLAIDLAKSTFQVCGVNRQGKEVFNRAISRKKLTALIAYKYS